jgi:hypothetical protein
VVLGVNANADITLFADGHPVGSGPAAYLGTHVGLNPQGLTFARIKLGSALAQGQRVTATQTVNGSTGPHSTTPVVVIGVPSNLSLPDVRTFPVTGTEALLVRGLFPGVELTVRVTRGGVDSFETMEASDFEEIALTPSPLRTGDRLQVIQRLGNIATGWTAPQPIEPWGGMSQKETHLPPPVFELIPQACDRGIRLGGMVPGATAMVEVNGDRLRQRSLVSRVVVPVRSYVTTLSGNEGLRAGDRLTIWQEFPSSGQRSDPKANLVHTVGPATPPAKPTLWSGICPKSAEIVVAGFRPGARIRIYQKDSKSAPFTLRKDLTHLAPLLEPDVVPIPVGFPAGAEVAVTQAPCLDVESEQSFPVEVMSLDNSAFGATWISKPVLECANGVVANNLVLGASASIWSDALGGPVTPSKIVMDPLPNWFESLILPGDKLRIVQSGCVPAGAQESPRVAVQSAYGQAPQLDYLFGDDRSVWVWCSAQGQNGADIPAAGARVEVFVIRGEVRHWAGAGQSGDDGWAEIKLTGWILQGSDYVAATAQLCGDPISNGQPVAVNARRPPRQPEILAPASTTNLDHPTFRWRDPDAGTPYEALSFTFAINEASGAPIRPQAHTDQTSLAWSGAPALVAGHSYRWQVIPVGRRGEGPPATSQVTVAAPASKPTPAPAQKDGFSKLVVWNCNSTWNQHDNRGTVSVHMRDRAAGTGFQLIGTLDVGYPEGGSSCGPGFSTGTEYPLTDGHVYDFVFVDPELPGCDGDPNTVACGRLSLSVIGKHDGPPLNQVIS